MGFFYHFRRRLGGLDHEPIRWWYGRAVHSLHGRPPIHSQGSLQGPFRLHRDIFRGPAHCGHRDVGRRLQPSRNGPEYSNGQSAVRGNRSHPSLLIRDISRLQISANGNRLAVASYKAFVVLDLPSSKVVLEGDGQYASLSPQGNTLAFLDTRRGLVLTDLATEATKILANPWWTVVGVGAWSPDGKFLLAGGRPLMNLVFDLLAVDTATADFARVMRLEMEGDYGQTCVWIKRRLLSGP